MPSIVPPKTVEQIAAEAGFAPDALIFVQQSLGMVAERIHGQRPKAASRHISGQQLSMGLRDVALETWGQLAGTVLNRWGIYSTLDFGRIVYAMIDAGFMAKTPEDSLDDFRAVYDFKTTFERDYRFPDPAVKP